MDSPTAFSSDVILDRSLLQRKETPLRYSWAITIAIFLMPGVVSALSLDEALTIAREQASKLQMLDAETRQAQAIYQQSFQALLPTISADAIWLRADSSLISPVPLPSFGAPMGIQRTDLGPVDGTLTGVQIVQPLYNADALKLRKAAELSMDASHRAEQWGAQAMRLEVARQYFHILRLAEHQKAAGMSLLAASKAARLAEGGYQQGLASRLDMEQAAAEYAAAEARVAQAEAAIQQARYGLKSLLGLAPQKWFELTDSLPHPLPPVNIGVPAPRKDLQARKLAVEAADARTNASEAAWIPRLNLLARQQWAQGNELLDDAEGWLLAVNLQWTLFDGFGRQGRIAEARALAEKARAVMGETRRRIYREQAIAMSQWQAGFSIWQAAKKSVQAAERAAQLATRRYEEGVGSMTDLLVVRARLDHERALLIDSHYQTVLAAMNYYLQNGRDPLLVSGKEPL